MGGGVREMGSQVILAVRVYTVCMSHECGARLLQSAVWGLAREIEDGMSDTPVQQLQL